MRERKSMCSPLAYSFQFSQWKLINSAYCRDNIQNKKALKKTNRILSRCTTISGNKNLLELTKCLWMDKGVLVMDQRQLRSGGGGGGVVMVRFRMWLCRNPAWSSFMQEKWWLLKSEVSKWIQSYLSCDTKSRLLSVSVNCVVWPRGA